jgi:hypothetical protein
MAHVGQVVAVRLVGSVLALVATVSQYLVAPLTAPQLKLGVVETPVAPLEGLDRLGAGRLAATADTDDVMISTRSGSRRKCTAAFVASLAFAYLRAISSLCFALESRRSEIPGNWRGGPNCAT